MKVSVSSLHTMGTAYFQSENNPLANQLNQVVEGSEEMLQSDKQSEVNSVSPLELQHSLVLSSNPFKDLKDPNPNANHQPKVQHNLPYSVPHQNYK